MGIEAENKPYKPGAGQRPTHFAGRHEEIKVIEDALNEIKGRAGQMDHVPERAIVLLGPRGVGKTVLLERAIREAKKRGIKTAEVDRQLLSASPTTLVNQVVPKVWFKRFLDKVGGVGAKISEAGVNISFKDAENYFSTAMTTFLSKKPLLLVLDEAHHCEHELLNPLFAVVQRCMRSDLPLAFIMAGTPGLENHLKKCKATYVERFNNLRFNTLSRDEAKDALEIPAKDAGRPMTPDALNLLLDWSDNYPFFIQMVGDYTWGASKARAGKEISIEDAKAGLVKANTERNNFYKGRYIEIFEERMLKHAVQLGDLVRKSEKPLDITELACKLAELNDGMDEMQAYGIVDGFQESGYLWCNDLGEMEPGIPSLFDYVKNKPMAEKA